MCFSAGASFATSSVLLVTGIITLKKVSSPKQIVLAAIPLIFSIQQFSEGMLWMSFMHDSYMKWQLFSAYTFLTFAQIVWPVWIPLSFFMLEKDAGRKKMLSILLFTGAALSALMIYSLLAYKAEFSVVQHHIRYELLFPSNLKSISNLLYFLPTVVSPLISTVRKAWIIGVLILASFIVSKLFFHDYVISVWCFFAAVISIIILLVIWAMGKKIA